MTTVSPQCTGLDVKTKALQYSFGSLTAVVRSEFTRAFRPSSRWNCTGLRVTSACQHITGEAVSAAGELGASFNDRFNKLKKSQSVSCGLTSNSEALPGHSISENNHDS